MAVRVPRDLGAAVRGRRRDLGWSQDRVADRADVSRRWLSSLEAGKPSVELDLVLRVLDALGLELQVAPADDSLLLPAVAAKPRPSYDAVELADVDLDDLLADLDVVDTSADPDVDAGAGPDAAPDGGRR